MPCPPPPYPIEFNPCYPYAGGCGANHWRIGTLLVATSPGSHQLPIAPHASWLSGFEMESILPKLSSKFKIPSLGLHSILPCLAVSFETRLAWNSDPMPLPLGYWIKGESYQGKYS